MTYIVTDLGNAAMPYWATTHLDWYEDHLLKRLQDGATIMITRPGHQPWNNHPWRKREDSCPTRP
jgi:hypothetical protein